MGDQRLNGRDDHIWLCTHPSQSQQHQTQRREMPPITDPVPYIAGKGHPGNRELIPREVYGDRPHVPNDRKVKLGKAEETDQQRDTGSKKGCSGESLPLRTLEGYAHIGP